MLVYGNAPRPIRAFLLFLVLGFIVDLVNTQVEERDIRRVIVNCYSLLEALFYAWFLYQLKINKAITNVSFYYLILVFPFWFVCHFVLKQSLTSLSAIFETVNASTLVFIAAFSILKLAERGSSNVSNAIFWILVGIFFYFFCANLIYGFIEAYFMNSIWFIHNAINILTYLIFTKNFLTLRQQIN
jgi:hypothetical protein